MIGMTLWSYTTLTDAADAPYRASASLDVLEAIRPTADALVLDMISTRVFS